MTTTHATPNAPHPQAIRTEFRTWPHPGVWVRAEHGGLSGDELAELLERVARGEGTLLHKGRNEVWAVDTSQGECVVKSFGVPHLVNQLVYGWLRPSKACRAFANALELRAIGVDTPEPLAYCSRRSWLGLRFARSWLITRRSSCPWRYEDLFTRPFPCAEEVLRAVGRLTARLHGHGLRHLDYGRANILFGRGSDGKVCLDLVDVNRMARGPVGMRDGCKNFERLPATAQMHRWMAEEYARERGFDAEQCYELMRAFRRTQPGQVEGEF